MTMAYPLINGARCSWADIEIKINRVRALAVQEITYNSKLEPGVVRGAGTRVLGRTRGQEEHEGSITLLKEEAQELIDALGDGFGEKAFDIVVSYRLGDESTVAKYSQDTLLGCRIKSPDQSLQQGTDAVKVKFELSVMDVLYNGKRISKG
jgi:hypothetical protein